MKKLYLLALLLYCGSFYSQNFNEVEKIVASDRDTLDQFGMTVAISGDYAIVGAYPEDHDTLGLNYMDRAGSAYIYEHDGNGNWNQVQKITASDRSTADFFGWRVGISGTYAVVSAFQEDHDTSGLNYINGAGSVYIFERDGNGYWNEVQKIVASDRSTATDHFGSSLSIYGNNIVVGAYNEDEDSLGNNTMPEAGSAYIFNRDSFGVWSETQKIVASDRSPSDFFGYSVAVSDSFIVVGARWEDEDTIAANTLSNAGSAYIFRMDLNGHWNEVQKIIASDRAMNDWFGYRVGISDDFIVVSGFLDDEDEFGGNYKNMSGSAYIFKKNSLGQWNETQKIVASDRDSLDRFGSSVSISGRYIIVGANEEDHDEFSQNYLSDGGSAYLFKLDTTNGNWSQLQKIVPSDRAALDWYGFSVSISGNRCIVGSLQDDEDDLGNNFMDKSGSAYIYEYQLITEAQTIKTNSKHLIYPNPTTGRIFIELEELKTNVSVVLIDLLGQTLFSRKYESTNQINLEIDEPSGVYFVQLRTDKEIITKRIIKK